MILEAKNRIKTITMDLYVKNFVDFAINHRVNNKLINTSHIQLIIKQRPTIFIKFNYNNKKLFLFNELYIFHVI